VPVRFSFIFSLLSLLFSSPPFERDRVFLAISEDRDFAALRSAFENRNADAVQAAGDWYTPSPERENLRRRAAW